MFASATQVIPGMVGVGVAAWTAARLGRVAVKARRLSPEILAVLTGMIPNALHWCYRTRVSNAIVCTPLEVTIAKMTYRAHLYFHGDLSSKSVGSAPALFLHGDDGGHPFNILHLIDRAVNAKKGPVYSLHVTYQHSCPGPHQLLIGQAIEHISARSCQPVIAVGYSHGCAEWVHRVCCRHDRRIGAIIAIAGRLKVTVDRPPSPDKMDLIAAVEQAMRHSSDFRLFQIAAGEHDWCMPPDASAPLWERPQQRVPDAMHINLLFNPVALSAFDRFFKEAASLKRA